MNAWLFRGRESDLRHLDYAKYCFTAGVPMQLWAKPHTEKIQPGDMAFAGYYDTNSLFGIGGIYAHGIVRALNPDGRFEDADTDLQFFRDPEKRQTSKPHAMIDLDWVADIDTFLPYAYFRFSPVFETSQLSPDRQSNKLTRAPSMIPLVQDQSDCIRRLLGYGLRERDVVLHGISDAELEARIINSKEVKPKNVARISHSQNPNIKEWLRRRANGCCEHPGCTWVGFQSDGSDFYFEVHHLLPRAEGGLDIPSNVAALCPNCHASMHYAHDAKMRRKRLTDFIHHNHPIRL